MLKVLLFNLTGQYILGVCFSCLPYFSHFKGGGKVQFDTVCLVVVVSPFWMASLYLKCFFFCNYCYYLKVKTCRYGFPIVFSFSHLSYGHSPCVKVGKFMLPAVNSESFRAHPTSECKFRFNSTRQEMLFIKRDGWNRKWICC